MTIDITIHGTATHSYTTSEISGAKRTKNIGRSGFTIGNVVSEIFTAQVPYFEDDLSPRANVNLYCNDALIQAYFVDKITRNYASDAQDRLTLSCFDRLAFANQPFDYTAEGVTYVSRDTALNYIATKIGADGYLIKSSVNVPIDISLGQNYTCKQVLELIATSYAANVFMHGNYIYIVSTSYDGTLISVDNTSKINAGRIWQAQSVKVSNDKTSATVNAVSAPDASCIIDVTIPCSSDVLADAASDMLSVLRAAPYLPFEIAKTTAIANDVDVLDRLNMYVCGYRPRIYNLTVNYNCKGAFATISAPDVRETQSAFAFEKPELKKGQKVGSVKLPTGNAKYGVTTTKSETAQSVGADAVTRYTALNLNNGELEALDVTSDEYDVYGGKVLVDKFTATVSGIEVEKPVINVQFPAGVFGDEATDLITELKSGGGKTYSGIAVSSNGIVFTASDETTETYGLTRDENSRITSFTDPNGNTTTITRS